MSTEQVVDILRKYQNREIKAREAAAYLQVSRPRLYQLLAKYEAKGSAFTIAYRRRQPTRRIDPDIENNIKRELTTEKEIIGAATIITPLRRKLHLSDILTWSAFKKHIRTLLCPSEASGEGGLQQVGSELAIPNFGTVR